MIRYYSDEIIKDLVAFSMSLKRFIGVDVSKNTLDFAVLNAKEKAVVLQLHCKNNSSELVNVKTELRAHHIPLTKSTAVICENTGMYMRHLINFFSKQGCSLCVESALQIKRSLGIKRGKSDQIDSRRIAAYGLRNSDKLRIWNHPRDIIFRLRDLLNFHEKICKLKNAVSKTVNEKKLFYSRRESRLVTHLIEPSIDGLTSSLCQIVAEIRNIVKNDSAIRNQFTLLNSIPGVGEITALYLISFTNEFSTTTSALKLASYAGIAPLRTVQGRLLVKRTSIQRLTKH